MKIKINLSRNNIKCGKRGSASYCPLALAIRDTLEVLKVSVYHSTVEIGKLIIKLPRSAQRFITKFDDGQKVVPFSFTL